VLKMKPSNTVALVHQRSVELKCSSSLPTPGDHVSWQYQPPGSTEWQEVVHGPGLLVNKFKPRYHFTKDSIDGMQNLMIYNITYEDAGRYKCLDEGAAESAVRSGEFASAELIVLDTRLYCAHDISEAGIVGGDICGLGLHPDAINISCTIYMRGNVSTPILEWTRTDGGHVVIESQSSSYDTLSRRATVHMRTRADEQMNGSQIIARTNMLNSSNWTHTDQLNLVTWTSPVMELLCECCVTSRST